MGHAVAADQASQRRYSARSWRRRPQRKRHERASADRPAASMSFAGARPRAARKLLALIENRGNLDLPATTVTVEMLRGLPAVFVLLNWLASLYGC